MKKDDKKARFEKLTQVVKELETTKEVKAWLEHEKLSGQEKNKIKTLWKQYYIDVRNTRAYKRFMEQRDAFKAGKIGEVVRLAREARDARLNGTRELAFPYLFDPDLMKMTDRVKRYLAYRFELEGLNQTTVPEFWE